MTAFKPTIGCQSRMFSTFYFDALKKRWKLEYANFNFSGVHQAKLAGS